VRQTAWSNATGFWLNGKPFKILGNANHQDFPAVGVAVPDHLQWYRVQVCRAPKVIPHHETFSTTIQPSYSSTKG
jgi:hypothetical protein